MFYEKKKRNKNDIYQTIGLSLFHRHIVPDRSIDFLATSDTHDPIHRLVCKQLKMQQQQQQQRSARATEYERVDAGKQRAKQPDMCGIART